MPTRSGPSIPLPVARALRKLGSDIRDARRRRRIPTATMAERASISRDTLHKVEKGHPGVQIGIYATVLFVLGLANRIGEHCRKTEVSTIGAQEAVILTSRTKRGVYGCTTERARCAPQTWRPSCQLRVLVV